MELRNAINIPTAVILDSEVWEVSRTDDTPVSIREGSHLSYTIPDGYVLVTLIGPRGDLWYIIAPADMEV